MKGKSLIVILMLLLSASPCFVQAAPMKRVVVGFKASPDQALIKQHGGRVTRTYGALRAVA